MLRPSFQHVISLERSQSTADPSNSSQSSQESSLEASTKAQRPDCSRHLPVLQQLLGSAVEFVIDKLCMMPFALQWYNNQVVASAPIESLVGLTSNSVLGSQEELELRRFRHLVLACNSLIRLLMVQQQAGGGRHLIACVLPLLLCLDRVMGEPIYVATCMLLATCRSQECCQQQ